MAANTYVKEMLLGVMRALPSFGQGPRPETQMSPVYMEFGGWWNLGAGGQDKQIQLRAPVSRWPLRSWKVGENVAETQALPGPNGKAEGRTRAGGRDKLCGLAVLPDSCHLLRATCSTSDLGY